MTAPLLRCRDLHCVRPLWREGASHVRGISADFDDGCFHAISGNDGCGKNLLLHLLGLLEQPDDGEIWLEQKAVTRRSEAERDCLRQSVFGFLFPAHALLPSLTVLENIAFPVLKAGGTTDAEQAERTLDALRFCGLESVADQTVAGLPPETSATAAFARAIAHRPRLLIAESPAAEEILAPLARRAVNERGLLVIWGTRPGGPASRLADRELVMVDGRLATTVS